MPDTFYGCLVRGRGLLRLFVVAVSMVLTACGGGGGGGGSGESSSEPTPQQNFPTVSSPQLAAVDGQPLATMDRRSGKVMLDAVLFFADVGDGLHQQLNQSLASPSHSNQIESQPASCSSGSGQQTYQYAPSGIGRLVTESQDCSDGRTTNRGIQDFTVTRVDSNGYPLDYMLVFSNWEIEEPQSEVHVRLQGALTVTTVGSQVTILQNLEVTDLDTGEWIRAANFATVVDKQYGWPEYRQALRSGQVYVSGTGRASVSVDAAQRNLLTVSGAIPTRVVVDSNTMTLLLHTNGDNQPDAYAFNVPLSQLFGTNETNQLPEFTVNSPAATDRSVAVTLGISRIFDSDYDFLELRGTVVSGPPGASYQFDFTAPMQPLFTTNLPGDYVVRLSVEDNEGVVHRDVNVHVRALVPVVAVSPAQAIEQAQPWSLSLQPSLAIDGPYQYHIVSAPTGVAVDGDGLLTWTPSVASPLPSTLHRVLVEVSNNDHAVQRTLFVTVNDDAKPDPIVGIDNRFVGTVLAAGNFDSDSQQEILLSNNGLLFTIEWNGAEYVKDWVLPFDITLWRGYSDIDAVAVNLDGDPALEIVVGNDDEAEVVVLDAGREIGRARSTLRETARSSYPSHAIVAVDDIDLDGRQEIVALFSANVPGPWYSATQVVVFDALSLTQRWMSAPMGPGSGGLVPNRGLRLANVDADPALEIIVSGGYVIDGSTGDTEWHHLQGFGETIEVGDVLGNGTDQIIGYSDAWTGVQIFDARQQLVMSSPGSAYVCGIRTTDVDINGVDEVLMHTCASGSVTAYSFAGGVTSTLWSFPSSALLVGGAPLLGDFDNDSQQEVIWSSRRTEEWLTIASPQSMAVEWNSGDNPLFDRFDIALDFQADSTTHEAWFLGRDVDASINPVGSLQPWVARIRYDDGALIAGPAPGGIAGSYSLTDLVLVDYDADQRSEVVVRNSDSAGGHVRLVDPISGLVERSYSQPGGSNGLTAVGRLNSDASADLAIEFGNQIVFYDALNDTLIGGSVGLAAYSSVQDMQIADLDGDGNGELLVLADQTLLLYRNVAGQYQVVDQYVSMTHSLSSLLVEDIDGDTVPEVTLSMRGYMDTSRVVVLNVQLDAIQLMELPGRVTNLAVDRFGGAGALLAIVSGDASLLADTRESRTTNALMSFTPSSGVVNWYSRPLQGVVGERSMHYGSHGIGGAPRLLIGTSAAMYIVQ